MVLNWIWTVAAICLNIAVIVKILLYKKKSRLYMFLLHLAIADLVTALMDMVPNSMERTLGYYRLGWLAGDAFCKIQRTIAQCSAMASNYILACMSADRAMVVYRPMHSINRGKTLQKRAIGGCWIFNMCLSLIITPFIKVSHNFGEDPLCEVRFSLDRATQHYGFQVMFIVMFVFMVAIPFIVIVISYAILVVCIYRRGISPRNSVKQSETLITTRVFNNAIPRSKIRTIKLTIGIVMCFLVCWIPFFVVMFMNAFDDFNHPMIMIMVTFYYLNSVANPIVFFIYHIPRSRSFPRSFYSSETVRGRSKSHEHGRCTPNTTKMMTSNGNECVQNTPNGHNMIPLVNKCSDCSNNGK